MEASGRIMKSLRWLLFGLLELCGVRMWDQSKTGLRDNELAAELELDKRINTEAQSLSLTKDQVDTITRSPLRVAANRKA
jgi:hypothetical protein